MTLKYYVLPSCLFIFEDFSSVYYCRYSTVTLIHGFSIITVISLNSTSMSNSICPRILSARLPVLNEIVCEKRRLRGSSMEEAGPSTSGKTPARVGKKRYKSTPRPQLVSTRVCTPSLGASAGVTTCVNINSARPE